MECAVLDAAGGSFLTKGLVSWSRFQKLFRAGLSARARNAPSCLQVERVTSCAFQPQFKRVAVQAVDVFECPTKPAGEIRVDFLKLVEPLPEWDVIHTVIGEPYEAECSTALSAEDSQLSHADLMGEIVFPMRRSSIVALERPLQKYLKLHIG